MQTPEKLKKEFNRVEGENWTFRAFLKGTEPDDLDKLVNEFHSVLFKEMDCKACRNCCKNIVPALSNKDIARLSKTFEMTFDEFKAKYLVKSEGEWVINSKPCPFLSVEGCSVYDVRPTACREYPYTDKKETVHRLYNMISNCEVCPVVFEVIERLKKVYKKEFEEYKEKMIPYWDKLFGGKSHITF